MKKTSKLISILLVAAMILSFAPISFAAEGETVILYTNDVHCAIDDYSVLAAYKAQLESQGNTVILVDAGDAIQGEIIGTLTDGAAVVDIMNAVGYDYAVPGNHEYDYGMETFLNLAENEAEFKYTSSNFYYLPGVRPVFEPYYIEDANGMQIAFVGITTPESVTKSTPEYFKDENKNFIYGFPTWDMEEGVLTAHIQESVDDAIAEGADIVVAVGHLGIEGVTDGWKSTDVIAQTTGIDYFIDAHSHETIESAEYKNKNEESVTLSSTGTKFANFGQLTIKADGSAEFKLINPDNIDVEAMSDDAKSAYNTVKAKIDGYNAQIAYLYEEIGTSEAKLVAYDTDGSWLVRKQETNVGDFVADAYRAVTGADVAIANGGGIRADVAIGGVSRKSLMDVNAFNNEMCVIEITGQQLIDVLEHGARECPDPIGGFFQVSGVTFEIHTYRESPVATDTNGNFEGIDETMERRVENVVVGGKPVDLDETYTLAGSTYVLTQGGDGLTMLEDEKVVQNCELTDSEMLIKYFTENLSGKITAEKYGNADGRIKIVDKNPDVIDYDCEIKYGETIIVMAKPESADDHINVKFVPEKDGNYILKSESEDIDPYCSLVSADGEDELEWADDENGSDFILKYEFEAGKTYYFIPCVYGEDAQEYKITLVCGHSYSGGICSVCGAACDHAESDALGFCPCGEKYLGNDIKDGDEFTYDAEEYNNESGWYRFVPEVSGAYCLEDISDVAASDSACIVYDADGERLSENQDADFEAGDYNFKLIYGFEAGKTYYFEVYDAYEDASFEVKLSRVTHTADDGSVHYVDYAEYENSTCIEHGYSEGLYCPDCEKYVSGHEELELSDYHNDENADNVCDDCGIQVVYCDHMCHKGGIMGFFWSIVRFFSKLFGSNPICFCGMAHY